jgi:dTDP-4-dehydrorhamnose reductase
MRILITGGKSAMAFKLLKEFKEDEVIMADYGEMPQFPSKEYQFISLGIQNQDTIAHTLLTSCLDNAVNAILPVNDFEIEAVVKSRILFEEFDIQVLTPAELNKA